MALKPRKKYSSLGAEFWTNCLDWSKSHKVLSHKDHEIMAVACRVPKKIPSEKQCIYLTALLDQLAEEACPYIAELQ